LTPAIDGGGVVVVAGNVFRWTEITRKTYSRLWLSTPLKCQ